MFQFNDGGREAAGFKGSTRDCVVRAIAIAAQMDYREVYTLTHAAMKDFSKGRSREAHRARGKSPRSGVPKSVIKIILNQLGFEWTPTMHIGQGCKTHLRGDELPPGRLICKTSKHLVAVVDGVINDTYDSTRNGSRCVYGYWTTV